MTRILLIHWNEKEASRRAAQLAQAGYEVDSFSDRRADPRRLLDELPDVFVIDLAHVPSQGRETGGWLRRRRETRRIPLVFVEGDPEKTQRVRELLPDAAYATWETIEEAIRGACAMPIADPVVPGAMDAYAGAPLVKKLGIAAKATVALIDPPDGFPKTLEPLPDGARIALEDHGAADVVCLFVRDAAALEHAFPDASARVAEGGRLWIAWPKRSSGVRSDLTQVTVRAFGLERGFVDYRISAFDGTWSGLCFARRQAE